MVAIVGDNEQDVKIFAKKGKCNRSCGLIKAKEKRKKERKKYSLLERKNIQ